jgi:flagellar hook-associated protein 2
MAVTSTSSSSAANTSTKGIDVATIVSGLMAVEQQPVEKLQAQIDQKTTVISTLGVFKAKVSTLEATARALENTSVYTLRDASSTDSSVVAATAGSAAVAGSYTVKIAQTAAASQFSLGGFTEETDPDDESVDASGFSFSIGGVAYAPTVGSVASLTDLVNWINGLDVAVVAQRVSVGDGTASVVISGTATGAENAVTLSGSVLKSSGAAAAQQTLMLARDSVFSINGLALQRGSNRIDDAVSGLTLQFNAPVDPPDPTDPYALITEANFAHAGAQTETINVRVGSQDLATPAVKDFVTAFNDLVTFSREQTVASADATKRGSLNADMTIRSFMDGLRNLYNNSVSVIGNAAQDFSFSSVGLEMQRDGKIKINEAKLGQAVADGLQEKLASGVRLGKAPGSAMGLTTYLTNSLKTSSGIVTLRISDVESQQATLEDKKTRLEDRLVQLQARYYSQYAALDALLFRMQTQSDSLASAIQSLVNSQEND